MKSLKILLITVLLPLAAFAAPFDLSLVGTTMQVSSAGKTIVNWFDYSEHQVFGDIIGLLDTKGEFAAYGSNGRVIVKAYYKTSNYWLRPGFIALLDTDGEFDMYSTATGKQLIRTWHDVVRADVGPDSVGLLDHAGIFEAYTSTGKVIVKDYHDAVDFALRRNYVAILDRAGVFDVYRTDGVRLVKDWKDTAKYIASGRFAAVMDHAGVLDVYRIPDGFRQLSQNGVTDVREVRGGVQYLQNGVWKFLPL